MKLQRLNKVIEYLEQFGLNQTVVSDPSSIFYLTGINIDPGERLLTFLVRTDGTVTLFINRLFPLEEQAGLEIVYYNDGDDAVQMLADTVCAGKLGIDKVWPANFLLQLMAKRRDLEPVLGSQAVDKARKYKDAEEVELMRAASRVNDSVMAEAIAALDAGLSEREMVGIVGNLHVKHGADAALPQLVCFGAGCSEPHHDSGPALMKAGDSVLLDIFAPVKHYWCDMTRTVFYKGVSAEQKKVYETVRAANLAGIAAVRPGVSMKEVDYTARKVIEDAGYGKFFTHRLGHSIGLNVHEPPDCSAASNAFAEPGMCFSIEPGIYLPGKWGVRIEDLVVVTEDGVEILNAHSKELMVVK